MLQLGQNSPLALQISGLRGTDFAAWTLTAFTISVRAGALIRREPRARLPRSRPRHQRPPRTVLAFNPQSWRTFTTEIKAQRP